VPRRIEQERAELQVGTLRRILGVAISPGAVGGGEDRCWAAAIRSFELDLPRDQLDICNDQHVTALEDGDIRMHD
jgi:hypothetical protein